MRRAPMRRGVSRRQRIGGVRRGSAARDARPSEPLGRDRHEQDEQRPGAHAGDGDDRVAEGDEALESAFRGHGAIRSCAPASPDRASIGR
ncbi:hypothetical protein C5C13_03430 [Clavibacter michiganensis]|nr:hypothetical protein C5C13_03430 [Clavibacter michiganensis]